MVITAQDILSSLPASSYNTENYLLGKLECSVLLVTPKTVLLAGYSVHYLFQSAYALIHTNICIYNIYTKYYRT